MYSHSQFKLASRMPYMDLLSLPHIQAALRACIGSEHHVETRRAAIEALGLSCSSASLHAEALAALLQDNDPAIRAAATIALKRIELSNHPAVDPSARRASTDEQRGPRWLYCDRV